MQAPNSSPVRADSALVRAASSALVRAGAVLTALFAVVLVLVCVDWGPLHSADHELARDAHRSAVAHDGWTDTSRTLTDWVWDPWTMRAVLAVAVGWLVSRRSWRLAALVTAAGVASAALQQGLKAAVGRDRPTWQDPVDSAHYAAFPSGHALTTTVACGLVLWLVLRHGAPAVWRRVTLAVGVVSALGVGATRVYLGVHWPTDVLGGWLLGAALVCWTAAAYGPVRGRPEAGARTAPRDGRVPS